MSSQPFSLKTSENSQTTFISLDAWYSEVPSEAEQTHLLAKYLEGLARDVKTLGERREDTYRVKTAELGDHSEIKIWIARAVA